MIYLGDNSWQRSSDGKRYSSENWLSELLALQAFPRINARIEVAGFPKRNAQRFPVVARQMLA